MKKSLLILSLLGIALIFSSCIIMNDEPEAIINVEEKVLVGTSVDLHGNFSWDPDGEELEYRWEVINAPSGSVTGVVIRDYLDEEATFTPDVTGDYTIELTVSDYEYSDTETVVVSAQNLIVNAGTDASYEIGDTALSLPGTQQKSPSVGTLSYAWTVESSPANSSGTYTLGNANTQTATFEAIDLGAAGSYALKYTVTDGIDTDSDTVDITVQQPILTTAPANLSAVYGEDQIALSWDTVPYAEEYVVYRTTSQGGFGMQIARTATTSFDDLETAANGPVPGPVYYYTVAASNSRGAGPESSEDDGMLIHWEIVNPSYTMNIAGDYSVEFTVNGYGDETEAYTVAAYMVTPSSTSGYDLVGSASYTTDVTADDDIFSVDLDLPLYYHDVTAAYPETIPNCSIIIKIFKTSEETDLLNADSWDATAPEAVTFPSESSRQIGFFVLDSIKGFAF